MTAITQTQLEELVARLKLEQKEIQEELATIDQQAEPVSSVEESGRVGRSVAIQSQ